MPTPQQVHVDQPLTDVSIAFLQDQDAFVSMDAAPSVPVQNQSDVYYEYPLEAFTSTSAQRVGDGDETPEIDYDATTSQYHCDVYGAHGEIGDQTRGNADSQFDLESETTEQVTRDLLLNKEQDWHDTFFTTGTWTTDIDITSSSNSWDTASGTPIKDISSEIETIEARTGFRPNTFISTAPVMREIMNNDNVVDRIKYTQTATGQALRNAIGNVLDVDNVMMTRAVKNSAAEGADASVDYVNSSDEALLCYLPDSPGLRTPSAMYTFSWTEAFQGQASNEGMAVRTLRDQKGRSDWIEGLLSYDHQVISADLGIFFHNVLA